MKPLDLTRMVEVLLTNDVGFVAIGAFAVAVHGEPRMTSDLDVVPDPDRDNIERLVAALTQVDACLPSGKRFDPGVHAVALRRGKNATLDTKFGGLDIVQRLAGVPDYAGLRSRSLEVSVSDSPVRVCSLADLRAMKEAAGRPQDLADLANLPTTEPKGS